MSKKLLLLGLTIFALAGAVFITHGANASSYNQPYRWTSYEGRHREVSSPYWCTSYWSSYPCAQPIAHPQYIQPAQYYTQPYNTNVNNNYVSVNTQQGYANPYTTPGYTGSCYETVAPNYGYSYTYPCYYQQPNYQYTYHTLPQYQYGQHNQYGQYSYTYPQNYWGY